LEVKSCVGWRPSPRMFFLNVVLMFVFVSQLDVKEAAEVPTEHPQWDISEEEDEQDEDTGHISEYTTDEDVEEDD